MIYFFPWRWSSLPEMQAASPVAPAPSTTLFSISTNLNIARAMSFSATTTVRSTHDRAHANALLPTYCDINQVRDIIMYHRAYT